MSSEWAYKIETERLLGLFMETCAKAGLSNSGIMVSATASIDLDKAHYLKGVILARIDGVSPPFQPGNLVRANCSVKCQDWQLSYTINAGKSVTVAKIHYIKGKWFIEATGWAKDRRVCRIIFPANAFSLVPQKVVAKA